MSIKIIIFFKDITNSEMLIKVMRRGCSYRQIKKRTEIRLFFLGGQDPGQGPGQGHRQQADGNKKNDVALPGLDNKCADDWEDDGNHDAGPEFQAKWRLFFLRGPGLGHWF